MQMLTFLPSAFAAACLTCLNSAAVSMPTGPGHLSPLHLREGWRGPPPQADPVLSSFCRAIINTSGMGPPYQRPLQRVHCDRDGAASRLLPHLMTPADSPMDL